MLVVRLQGKTRFLQKKECCAGALEGRFIATLCRLTGAKTVLEVGMFTGTTTLAVAQQLPADGRVRLAQRTGAIKFTTCGSQIVAQIEACTSRMHCLTDSWVFALDVGIRANRVCLRLCTSFS